MKASTQRAMILMADDDPDDCLMAQKALEQNLVLSPIRFVSNGEELMDYLKRRGRYADPASSPRPSMILLDLNMPRLDGREALMEIKSTPDLRSIPVIVLTTSRSEEDILQCYQLGANSFITKPINYEGLLDVMRGLKRFWLELVELPGETPNP